MRTMPLVAAVIAAILTSSVSSQPELEGPAASDGSPPLCPPGPAFEIITKGIEQGRYPQIRYIRRLGPEARMRECDRYGCYFNDERPVTVCMVPGTGR